MGRERWRAGGQEGRHARDGAPASSGGGGGRVLYG
jgi:hypothetical protein